MKSIALVLLVFIFSCSVNDHSGNGSETTNHIAGVLTFSDSSKVIGANVSLYKIKGLPKSLELFKETLSDNTGAYIFDSLSDGEYSIIARHQASQSTWLIDKTLKLTNSEKENLSGIIKRSAFLKFNPDSLNKKIPFEFGDKWTLVFDELYQVDLFNKDTIYEIPPGNYSLSYRVENQKRKAVKDYAYDRVEVKSNDTLILKELNPYQLFDNTTVINFLEDFEDKTLSTDFGSVWWIFDDNNDGAFSTIEYASADTFTVPASDNNSINQSQWALKLNYSFKKDQSRFVGFGIDFSPYPHYHITDLSAIDTLKFKYKGSGKAKFKVCLTSLFSVSTSPECMVISESLELISPIEWTEISIPWFKTDLLNEPQLLALNNHFLFMLVPIDSQEALGELWLDDIYFGS